MLNQAIFTGHIIRLNGSTIDAIAVSLSFEWDTTSLAFKVKLESLLIHLKTHQERIDQLLLELAEMARRKKKLAGMRQELRQNGAPFIPCDQCVKCISVYRPTEHDSNVSVCTCWCAGATCSRFLARRC